MIYYILKTILAFAARVYFKRIQVIGRENIPSKGPILLACNHPSAFMEGCLVAGFTRRPMHFIVRGDVFQLKWLKPLLNGTNQIPIFRFRDGFSKLRENKSAFDTIFNVLNSGAAIIIYPEGSTEWVKQHRPLQKGLAKIAFGSMEKFEDMPLSILPIGINYTDVLKFRSDVMISIGKPIDVRPYYKDYTKNNLQAITELTGRVKEILDPHIIHLNEPDELWTEPLLRTAAALYGERKLIFSKSSKSFDAESSVAAGINNMTKAESEAVAEEIKAMNLPYRYESSLFIKKSKLTVMITAILVAIPALIGYVLNLFPFVFGKRLAQSKVKEMEFYTPLLLAAWSLSHTLILIILIIILFLAGAGWWSLMLLLFPVMGVFTIIWFDHKYIIRTYDQVKKHEKRLKEITDQLMKSPVK
jgi:1-acyl-sn-glycerol-3-phosphate acyltransferase